VVIGKKAYRPWFTIGDNGGQMPLDRQDAGLGEIDFKGKTVLEIGCAEGLVSFANLKRGAKLVHGIEYRDRAVEVARSMAGILGHQQAAKFFQGDIRQTRTVLNQASMLERYDIVMAMAVLQKVADQATIFRQLLAKCASTMVLRLPERALYRYRLLNRQWSWGPADPVEVAKEEGFSLAWESCGYPKGKPPFPVTGEAWLGVFQRNS
jgi:2-polyprenyl-3-methyl-5-hydroxy-6-metoxy-1,4-benzoquinol methylase